MFVFSQVFHLQDVAFLLYLFLLANLVPPASGDQRLGYNSNASRHMRRIGNTAVVVKPAGPCVAKLARVVAECCNPETALYTHLIFQARANVRPRLCGGKRLRETFAAETNSRALG
jgi:hypothetical protein